MTEAVARVIQSFALAVAAAVLLKAYAHVGDGFSAGAIAGLGAVVRFACQEREAAARAVGAPWAWGFVVGGLLGVVALTLGPLLVGLPPVTHFPRPGEHVTRVGALELHTALAFDVAAALLVYGALVGTFDRMFRLPEGGGGGA